MGATETGDMGTRLWGTRGWGRSDVRPGDRLMRDLGMGLQGQGTQGEMTWGWGPGRGPRLGLPGHRAPPGGGSVTSSLCWMQTRLSIW